MNFCLYFIFSHISLVCKVGLPKIKNKLITKTKVSLLHIHFCLGKKLHDTRCQICKIIQKTELIKFKK